MNWTLERIWLVGREILPPAGGLPAIENVDVRYSESPEALVGALRPGERVSFLAGEADKRSLERSLGTRIVAARAFSGPRTAELLALHVGCLVDEIRLEHDLEIAEAVAWKGAGTGEAVSLDLLGKAMLEIFSCRDSAAIEAALVANAQAVAPAERIVLRVDPPYAPMAELALYQLAIPVQFDGKLLAHVYASFPGGPGPARDRACESIGEFLLGISDAIALALERNQMLATTEQTGHVWEASFDAVEDPVVILSADFRVVRANRAYAELVGRERANVIGIEDGIFARSDLEPYMDYPSSEWEFTLGKRHFRVFMDKIAAPLGDGRIVLRLHDTTSEKLLRERLLAHNQVADLGILIGSVAHEINNPIAGILLYAQMLLQEVPAGSAVARDIENVRQAAERCKRIVQTMLSLVRRSDNVRSEVDVSACIDDVLGLVGPEAKRLKIRIYVKKGDSAARPLLTSRNQLLQALFHLAQQSLNALADTAKDDKDFRGLIEISITEVAEDVQAGDAVDRELRIAIFDNARIIPQVSESSITFNVVKILIEEQGGRLAYSREGERNRQEAVFPLAVPQADESEIDSAP